MVRLESAFINHFHCILFLKVKNCQRSLKILTFLDFLTDFCPILTIKFLQSFDQWILFPNVNGQSIKNFKLCFFYRNFSRPKLSKSNISNDHLLCSNSILTKTFIYLPSMKTWFDSRWVARRLFIDTLNICAAFESWKSEIARNAISIDFCWLSIRFLQTAMLIALMKVAIGTFVFLKDIPYENVGFVIWNRMVMIGTAENFSLELSFLHIFFHQIFSPVCFF